MYVDESQKNFNLRIRKFMQIILKMCVADRVNERNNLYHLLSYAIQWLMYVNKKEIFISQFKSRCINHLKY